jgi:hypothetical protein
MEEIQIIGPCNVFNPANKPIQLGNFSDMDPLISRNVSKIQGISA